MQQHFRSLNGLGLRYKKKNKEKINYDIKLEMQTSNIRSWFILVWKKTNT